MGAITCLRKLRLEGCREECSSCALMEGLGRSQQCIESAFPFTNPRQWLSFAVNTRHRRPRYLAAQKVDVCRTWKGDHQNILERLLGYRRIVQTTRTMPIFIRLRRPTYLLAQMPLLPDLQRLSCTIGLGTKCMSKDW